MRNHVEKWTCIMMCEWEIIWTGMQQEDMQTPIQLLAETDGRFKVIFQTSPRRFFQKNFPRRFSPEDFSQKILPRRFFPEDFFRRFFPEDFSQKFSFQKIFDPNSATNNDKQTDLDSTSRFSSRPNGLSRRLLKCYLRRIVGKLKVAFGKYTSSMTAAALRTPTVSWTIHPFVTGSFQE